MTKDDLIEMIKTAKELGVTRIRTGEFEICFGEPSEKVATPIPEVLIDEKALEKSFKALSQDYELTSEELKYYATPYFDELQAIKEERQAEGAKEDVNN